MARSPIISVAALLSAVLLGLWLAGPLGRWFGEPAPQPESPTPTPTPLPPSASPTPAPEAEVDAATFRLAGVALSLDEPLAVIEMPDGSHLLLRVGEEVPGLGRLVRVGGDSVVVATETGEVTLWVVPAATPTPTNTRRRPVFTPRRSPSPLPGANDGSLPAALP